MIRHGADRTLSKAPPPACLRGARALLGLTQMEAAKVLNIARAEIAAAEADVLDDVLAERVALAYRDQGVVLNFDGKAWIVTRRLREGETRDAINGIATTAARSAAGFTQQTLATSARVSLRTVVALERGAGAMRTTEGAVAAALARRNVEVVGVGGSWGFRLSPADGADGPADEAARTDGPDRLVDPLPTAIDPERPSYLRLRVEIEGTKPRVWRELLVPENATFEDLHRAIQVAFGWRDAHWHEFEIGLRVGPASLNEDGSVSEGMAIDERLAYLTDIHSRTDTFAYLYDFGDSWRHTIRRVAMEGRGDRPLRPMVVGGALAGPVEDSGSYVGWNALARRLRSGPLEGADGDWLHQSGYGRDYDPDRFDVAAADDRLGELAFDIPPTWMGQYDRRRAVKVEAPFLQEPASIQPPRKSRRSALSRLIKLCSVEDFGTEKYEKMDGKAEETAGLTWTPSDKNGRAVVTRSEAADVLGKLLEFASDVGAFRGMPVRVTYLEQGMETFFIPDYEVTTIDKRGINKSLVHILSPHNIHLATHYLAIKALLAEEGLELIIMPNGVLEAGPVKLAAAVKYAASPSWQAPDREAAEFLGGLVQGGRRIPVKEAVRHLLENGFAEHDRREGGTPENRVLFRLMDCVAKGEISIDASAPDEWSSSIGPRQVFASSWSFTRLATEWEFDRIPRGEGRRSPRSGTKASRR